MKPFLTAEWLNIINLTYRVDPALLQPELPAGLTLDLREESAHVSLVAFEFTNTKIKGVKIPWHVNFPEINLRYYARCREKRGVVFLREFVPRYCIALTAQKLYNEPYQALAMTCQTANSAGILQIQHRLTKNKKRFSIELQAQLQPQTPPPTSVEHYFKEHDLGFGRNKSGQTLVYRVEHPVWEIYPVQNYQLQVDFGFLYGAKWKFLCDQHPLNVLLAKGSAVKVFPPQRVKNFFN